MTIDEDLSEGDRISNQAAVQYVTETLQIPDTKISDGDLGSLGANPTITIIESAQIGRASCRERV